MFGRKGRAAGTYPAPEYPLVVEPFAGSMAYTLHHRPAFAIGIERDDPTYDLWHRLTSMSAEEITDFPAPQVGERTTDRWVISAAQQTTPGTTRRTISPFMSTRFERQRRLALRHHDYASRSVLYRLGDYREAPDWECCWFIDPPYVGVRDGYDHGPDSIDYDELAEWVMTRRGQVIVCEGWSGSWLPFQHHRTFPGQPSRYRGTARPIVEKVLTRITHRKCPMCPATFPASRADATYCSPRCRQRARRRSTTP